MNIIVLTMTIIVLTKTNTVLTMTNTFIDLKDYDKNPHRASYGWTSNNSVFASVGNQVRAYILYHCIHFIHTVYTI